MYGRYNSFLGHNALFCAQRYSCNVDDVVGGCANSIIRSYICNSAEESQMQTAYFVRELICIRENILALSNNVAFAREELDDIIQLVCTS